MGEISSSLEDYIEAVYSIYIKDTRMSVNLSLIRYLLPDDEREEDELDARPAEPELKLPEERPAELGLKLLLEELLEEDLPELKLPDDRPVELLPVLKLPLEKELPDE